MEHRNEDFAREFYDNYVKDAADFLCEYRDGTLPRVCHDLWEEREGVMTYTVATVIAGLRAAANFARHFDQEEREERYEKVAAEMQTALINDLWSEEHGRFARRLTEDGEL
ncbi:MAG: glycoside hydrolase family 15 protein, partial [Halobacteriaceae archaeon]